MAHKSAGVDAADADDALLLHLLRQRARRTPVRDTVCKVADNEAGDPNLRAVRLVVLVVPTGVTNLRRRRDHDLAVVGGVGEDLLVSGHSGVEHDFTEGLPFCTEGDPVEDSAVLQDQDRGYLHVLVPLCGHGGCLVALALGVRCCGGQADGCWGVVTGAH